MSGTVVVSNTADALKAMIEGDKAKVDLSKATWLDKQLVEELRQAIHARSKIKKKEDDLDTEKQNIVAQIEVLLDAIGIQSALDPRSGSVTRYSQSRSSLNQSRLKEELLKKGVPAEVIVACFTKATSFSTSSGIKFTGA
jgi:ATP phosphoribosyltransferase regulatory subunit HisZ